MESKQWRIVEELEKLTEENAANFLSPAVYGQARVKGKYIRDANGKLVPVLVKTKIQPTPAKIGQCIRDTGPKQRRGESSSVFRKFFSYFFNKDRET